MIVFNFFLLKCEDEYCDLCYAMQHRKGTRASHHPIQINTTSSHSPALSKNGKEKSFPEGKTKEQHPTSSSSPSSELGGYNGVVFVCEENKSPDLDANANVDSGRYPSPPSSPRKSVFGSIFWGFVMKMIKNNSNLSHIFFIVRSWSNAEDDDKLKKKKEEEKKALQKGAVEEKSQRKENKTILEQAKYIPVRLTLV